MGVEDGRDLEGYCLDIINEAMKSDGRSRERRQRDNSRNTRTKEVSGERIRTKIVHCNQGRKFPRRNAMALSSLQCCSHVGRCGSTGDPRIQQRQ